MPRAALPIFDKTLRAASRAYKAWQDALEAANNETDEDRVELARLNASRSGRPAKTLAQISEKKEAEWKNALLTLRSLEETEAREQCSLQEIIDSTKDQTVSAKRNGRIGKPSATELDAVETKLRSIEMQMATREIKQKLKDQYEFLKTKRDELEDALSDKDYTYHQLKKLRYAKRTIKQSIKVARENEALGADNKAIIAKLEVQFKKLEKMVENAERNFEEIFGKNKNEKEIIKNNALDRTRNIVNLTAEFYTSNRVTTT